MTDNGRREEKSLGLSLLSGILVGKLAVAFGTSCFLNNSKRQKKSGRGSQMLISKLCAEAIKNS